jgi:signal transduction histidine kinase/CheY-like chemotaxis protein
MSIRIKIISAILLIAVTIIVFGIGTGLVFVQSHLEKTIENDMIAVADIADRLITTEIDLLKADASMAARNIRKVSDEDIQNALQKYVDTYDKFIGMTVVDHSGIAASCGTAATPELVKASKYIPHAFAGQSVFTTTRKIPDGDVVFYVCVPMEERVLIATVPGRFFSDMVVDCKIWGTGKIFMLDEEGTNVANTPYDRVKNRFNSIERAKTDSRFQKMSDTAHRMIEGKRGTGRYTIDGIDSLCVYAPVTGSKLGWSLGVIAVLEESPLQDVRRGMFIVAGVCLLLSIVASLFASVVLEKPYKKLNEVVLDLVRAREDAVASTEAKSDFLANMSHEMRTPLNAIIGLSELTLDIENVEDVARENLEKVYNSGVTLLSLINDILDISKIESGRFEIIPVEYDTPSLINDTVTLNIVRIGSKPITFQLNVDKNMPSTLVGDELRVKQIFNNLLSNAFKYTEEGTITWSIRCEPDGDAVWLISEISDTGIGIRQKDVEKLFSDYNQVDTKRNRKIEGTGLGLSICKSMVELMGGNISVESEYGKGSTFKVRIRQGKANNVPIDAKVIENLKHFQYSDNKRDRRAKLIRAQIPYARVLVVDDVPTNLDVARGMMKPYGMHIDCVSNGPAAVKLIRDEKIKYNAIFMDHMMPGMDGIEATRIIREDIGTDYAKNIPIIALTANAIVGNEDKFLQHGFQAFLSKPIDIMRMDFVINHWVRDKELEKTGSGVISPDNNIGKQSIINRASVLERFHIEGIDFKSGLRHFNGDIEIYLDVLKSYVKNTPPLLEQLRDGTKENLPNYAIVVHGIKGSSRGISAAGIGRRAEALERAAKGDNITFIEAQNDDFIETIQTLLVNLSAMLKEIAEENPKIKKKEPDAEVLAALLEASKNYDIDGVDKAMTELERYDYESCGELVEWLKTQVSVMGFKKIKERLMQE